MSDEMVQQAKGWGLNKSAFLAIILLAMHALTQQGERRANSWLFNRRVSDVSRTQLRSMHGCSGM